jgi:surface antigen Omp85-like protein
VTARPVSLASVLALVLWALPGRADADEPKRAVPNYDGRPPKTTTVGDVALWVPRILLSPLYFTSEFLIRRPLGAAVSAAERARVPTALYDFFTFGPEHKAGFAPIAFVDFGFQPDVGLYAFWDDAFFDGDDLRLHAAGWSSHWLAGSLTQRIRLPRDDQFTFKLSASRRPDLTFYGLGPNTLEAYQSRYGRDLIDGRALVDLALVGSSRLLAGVGIRSVDLYHGFYGSDPSVEQSAAAGLFTLPDGFGHGYTAEFNRLRLTLDSRPKDQAPGTGVRFELEAEQGNGLRASGGPTWLRYSGTLGGFYDLNEHGRVIGLSIATLFADPLGSEPIPFTELVSLGGDAPMRGFYPGRLSDRSAAVASARYRWPIAPWLAGTVRAEVGNVFGVHLEQLRAGLMRFSGSIGLGTTGSTDGSIEALVGFGTETFDHGAQVDSIRVLLGTNRGF